MAQGPGWSSVRRSGMRQRDQVVVIALAQGLTVWWCVAGASAAQTRGHSDVPVPPEAASTASTIAYTAERMRDPMESLLPAREPSSLAQPAAVAPRVLAPTQPPGLTRLEGMVWSAGKRQAIIDGEVYKVGDSVGGGVILDIDRAGVTIRMPGGRFLVSDPGPLAASESMEASSGAGPFASSSSTVRLTPLDEEFEEVGP